MMSETKEQDDIINGDKTGKNATEDVIEADKNNLINNGAEKEKKEEFGDEEEINKLKVDHYSQNKPKEFSSENFKVEIRGLPKYYPLGLLKKLLNNTLDLDAHRVKPGGKGNNVAFVNFKDEDSRIKALDVITGYKWQGSTLFAQKAKAAQDPVIMAKFDSRKAFRKDVPTLSVNERIQKAVTPYHNMPYEEQIKVKDGVARQVLRKFGNDLGQLNPELRKFVQWHKIRRKGQVCEFDDMVESPMREGYRNKCEFTIGKNPETEKPVVGFRVSSYKEGSLEVGPISHLRHLNDRMKFVVRRMEEYLEASEHKPFDPFSHEGIWRQLTLRTSNNDDVMLIVVIHPQELGESKLREIKEDVRRFFVEGGGKEAKVTSLFFKQYGQIQSGKEVEYEHIFGKTYIEETILGQTFRASPDAFLQVNTAACEVLYRKVSEVAEVDPASIVLDVCCGVGTIGLSLAQNAQKVLGVEMTAAAVENAKANAAANDVKNAVFYHGKAEDYINTLLARVQKTNTIAVVDPPRAGLSGSVMTAIRKAQNLDKLVYISCDPQAAITNFQALVRPRSKTYKGSFFVPIRATPIDLFPDTPHFELVVVFERFDAAKWDSIMEGNPRPEDQEYFNRVPELTIDQQDGPMKTKQKQGKKDVEEDVSLKGSSEVHNMKPGHPSSKEDSQSLSEATSGNGNQANVEEGENTSSPSLEEPANKKLKTG